jgi:hypothetical protein
MNKAVRAGIARSPDAAQRAALAERCAAEPGPRLTRDVLKLGPGSAKQREGALHRARDTLGEKTMRSL